MKKLLLCLPLAGTLPFIAGTILISLNIEKIPILGNVKTAFVTYAILICGFMAGSQWGQSLGSKSRATLYLPVFSNTLTITLWFGATLLGFFPVMILLAVLF